MFYFWHRWLGDAVVGQRIHPEGKRGPTGEIEQRHRIEQRRLLRFVAQGLVAESPFQKGPDLLQAVVISRKEFVVLREVFSHLITGRKRNSVSEAVERCGKLIHEPTQVDVRLGDLWV